MYAARTTTPGRPVDAYVGVQRILEVRPPGAGREWRLSLSAGAYWRLLVGSTTLRTGAAEANRICGLDIEDGNVLLWRGVCGTTFRRESTKRVSYSSVGSPGGEQISGNPATLEIPELILTDGFVIRSFTEGAQAADEYTAVFLLLDEITHGPSGIERSPHGLHIDVEREG